MLTGQPVKLDPVAQQRVASWALLKSMVATRTASRNTFIPPVHHRRAMKRSHRPDPDGARVWLAYRANLPDPIAPFRASMCDAIFLPLERVARGFPTNSHLGPYFSGGGTLYATYLQIKHFVAITVHHDWMDLQIEPHPRAKLFFMAIWPTTTTVTWPPVRPVDLLGNPREISQVFGMKPPEIEPHEHLSSA
jgi:hypothetical protein